MSREDVATPAETRISPRRRRLVTGLLGALFVLSFLAFLAAFVLRTVLLDPELYIQALASNAAYERVYTEVLADPAMQERFKAQVGVDLDLVVEELYAQLVAAAALVVPPSTLQAASETLIHGVVGYLRGDTPELAAAIQSTAVLDRDALSRRVVSAVVGAAAQQAAETDGRDRTVLDEPALRAYLSDLAEGRIRALPASVASAFVGELSGSERSRLAEAMLARAGAAVSRQDQLQVEAALASDDVRSAVALASQQVLRPRVAAAVAKLLDRVAAGGKADGVALVAAAIGEQRADVVNDLNRLRGVADLARQALLPLALLMLALLAGIVWLNGQSLRAMLAGAGWTLLVAAGAGVALWLLAGWQLKTLAAARLAATVGRPPGLAHLLGDVLGSISGAIFAAIWGILLFWLVVAGLALAVAYSARLEAWLRRLLAPVWPFRRWVLAGLFGLLVVLPLLGRMATARQLAANPPCNGHPELCDRPLNEVAYAASHNAMSITEYGWLWPMHDGTVTDQLEAGVRGLLIDTHYLEDRQGESEFLSSLSPAEREVAEEAIANFNPGGLAGAVLCHQSCRLGATDLGSSLDEIRNFLEQHPREVLFLIIQDEITAEDTGKAITEHGLEPYIYSRPHGDTWPTLRELIAADRRLIIMAENEGPPPDWYTNAWDETEETPYTFVFKEDFSCQPNRGGTGKPFFLLNHWIQRIAPNRADAAVVNDYDFLLARARQCAAERGKLPNFVAVNFYGQGDLFRVVDTLNGVGQTSETP